MKNLSYLGLIASLACQQVKGQTEPDTAIFGPGQYNGYGFSLALSGDTALVLGRFNFISPEFPGSAGDCSIYVRDGSTWSEQADLGLFDSADLSGETVVVRSGGLLGVFTRTGTNWAIQQVINNLNISSVAISGDTIVVGTADSNALVFTRSGVTWSQQAVLTPDDNPSFTQCSVDIDGDMIVLGIEQSSAAYVFSRTANTWMQESRLETSEPIFVGDGFGASVAISGDSVVVGAPFVDDETEENVGNAFVFIRAGATWSQQQRLVPMVLPGGNFSSGGERFGTSVAISGDSVVVGAPGKDRFGFEDTGSAYLFQRSSGFWFLNTEIIRGSGGTGWFTGQAVGIDNNTIAVGSPGADFQDISEVVPVTGSVGFYENLLNSTASIVVYDSLGQELANDNTPNRTSDIKLFAEAGTALTFTLDVANLGSVSADLQSVAMTSEDPDDLSAFNLSVPDISSSADLGPGESLLITLTYSPSITRSTQSVSVSIDNYRINLSGLGLSSNEDQDSDGLSDWAEFSLRALGFDWRLSQGRLVASFNENSASAGFLNQTEIAEVNGVFSLNTVDPTTQTTTLEIALEESLGLSGFSPILITPSEVSVDSEGKLLIEVSAPEDKKFYLGRFE